MEIYNVKQLREQRITIDKDCGCVNSCTRKVVLIDLDDEEAFEVTLIGNDALVPLKEGQKVLIDLKWDHLEMNNECYDEYFVKSIKPLEDDVKIEYVQDWNTHLV